MMRVTKRRREPFDPRRLTFRCDRESYSAPIAAASGRVRFVVFTSSAV